MTISNLKILLVEDHHSLAEAVCAYLEQAGFIVDYAKDGLTALHLGTVNEYDAILLDIMLPGIDGFEICDKLRNQGRIDTPIIMLTARDQLDDKLRGFAGGADDYLVKPFEMAELEARLHAIIKRSRGETSKTLLQVHDLSLDLKTMKVQRAGKMLKLSPTGLRILKILLRESPKVISREALERELWGDIVPDSDALRSHLYSLRKTIDRPFDTTLLHTVQSLGFKIEAPDKQSE